MKQQRDVEVFKRKIILTDHAVFRFITRFFSPFPPKKPREVLKKLIGLSRFYGESEGDNFILEFSNWRFVVAPQTNEKHEPQLVVITCIRKIRTGGNKKKKKYRQKRKKEKQKWKFNN